MKWFQKMGYGKHCSKKIEEKEKEQRKGNKAKKQNKTRQDKTKRTHHPGRRIIDFLCFESEMQTLHFVACITLGCV